jgi:hypothetical protein
MDRRIQTGFNELLQQTLCGKGGTIYIWQRGAFGRALRLSPPLTIVSVPQLTKDIGSFQDATAAHFALPGRAAGTLEINGLSVRGLHRHS